MRNSRRDSRRLHLSELEAVDAPHGVDHEVDQYLFGVVDGLEFVEFAGFFDGEEGVVGEEAVFDGVLEGAGTGGGWGVVCCRFGGSYNFSGD